VPRRGVTVRWINSRFRSRPTFTSQDSAALSPWRVLASINAAATKRRSYWLWVSSGSCAQKRAEISQPPKTDAVSFAALRFWALTLVCPVCGETHLWSHMHGTLRDQKTIH
jgi:hypothetical protein